MTPASLALFCLWVAVSVSHFVWAETLYTLYTQYADAAVQAPCSHDGYWQSRTWFAENNRLFLQALVPLFWFWRYRKASRDLARIYDQYPIPPLPFRQ